MITLSVNYTLNGKSYHNNVRTKGSFSIDSIKRELCSILIFDEINPNEGIRENIIEDIQQLIMNNIIIQSIEITNIRIDEKFLVNVEIESQVFNQPSKYGINIINNK